MKNIQNILERITTLVAMLLLAAPVAVRGQFTCTTNGGAITITGYNGPGGAVAIPATINGHPVTGITNEAFTQTNIASVSVPASVTSIGSQVFAVCFNLTAITVDPQNRFYSSRDGVLFDKSQSTLLQYPEGLAGSYTVPGSVTTIATGALAECGGLTSVSIPGSVSTLLDLAICSCPNLGSVTIAGNVTSLPNDLFVGCGSLTNVSFQGNAPTVAPPIYSGSPPIFYGLTNVTAYYLPGMTGWSNTFAGIPAVQLAATASAEFDFTTNAGAISITGYNCAGGLVIIPSAINGLPVAAIGANAFAFCTNLTGVAIPGSVTNIAGGAFEFCTGLSDLIILPGAASIGDGAFVGCFNLGSVVIPGSVNSIGSGAFEGCVNLTGVVFLPGLTNIGDGAFEGCVSLGSLTIPSTVASIGANAFESCISLNNVYFYGDAPAVGPGLFSNDSIPAVYYWPLATGWGAAFAGIPTVPGVPETSAALFTYDASGGSATITGYKGLGGFVVIPTNINGLTVTAIGNGWTPVFGSSLTSVVIPDSVTSIAGGTPEGATSLRGAAFMGCTGLTNLAILGSPTFGDFAFYQSSLTSAYIAGGTIGGWAVFDSSYGLTNVTLGNGVTSIGGGAFSGDPISSLYIPGSVNLIQGSAFDSTGLTNVIFGAGVSSIEDMAFQQSYILRDVLFLGNAPTVINISSDHGVFAFSPTRVYYLPGTTGWSNTFGSCIYTGWDAAPTVLWNPVIQTGNGNFGVQNNQFGFNITGTTNIPIVVQACANLANPVWTPLTNVTLTNGSVHFSEPVQSNTPARYYRITYP